MAQFNSLQELLDRLETDKALVVRGNETGMMAFQVLLDGTLRLGPTTNTFNTVAQRNSYATANAAWLASYDADPALVVIVGTTTLVIYSRAGGAWVEQTGVVTGPGGPAGAQARFVVYAYINASTAPTAAPTGGTYVRSTGALTLPAGYTAAPSTPASGSETYRTQAVVNPETDTDTVTLTWSVPSELPAYSVVALAEDAADEAETARDLAQQYAGQAQDVPAGSPRGDLVATSPTLPTAATGSNSVIAFGASELWTIDAGAPDGFEAGPTANNERLYLPDIHPAGSNGIWIVIEVADVEIAEVFISQGGIQGATGADRRLIIPVSLTADALVRVGFWPRSGATASYIQVTGNSDTLAADTVVKVYTAVVRGAAGSGGGGGGGVTIAQVLTQILAGTNITVDRTTAGQITIASTGGGGADDGVIDGITLANDGTVTVTRTVGADVTGDFSTGIEALIAAATFTASQIPDLNASKITAGILAVARIPDLDASKIGSGTFLATRIPDLSASKITSGAFVDARIPAGIARDSEVSASYAALAGATFTGAVAGIDPTAAAHFTTRSWVEGLLNPVQTHTNYIAISADTTFTEAEFLAGNTSTDENLVAPTFTSPPSQYIAIAVPDDEDDITGITQGGISVFTSWERITGTINISGVAHKAWRTTAVQNDLASGITYVATQG